MVIFSTGVFLQSRLINGRWMWVASEFEDSSFMDGVEVNPVDSAETESELLIPDEEE